jgi:uncharacterized protein (TIGR02246 family)
MSIAALVPDTPPALVAAINTAWRAGAFERLSALFHPDMVIAGPAGTIYARGRDACVESYRAFATQAEVLEYDAEAPVVQVWDDVTAVVAYAWSMTYRREGVTSTESGSDQFVCLLCGERWQAVHRLIVFDAAG